MRTEYKRDMNHNYLIIYGENEINTDSYQVRMLAGNVIPSVLKCRIQGMDGRFLIYFDITSKQALNVLYEEKKMSVEDIRLIFGGFVRAMEDAAEYLINPGQFIMQPEHIYLDVEKGQIYFCMMPGYEKDIKEQFQFLTEYILPKIDHQDGDAVILGYGVYKRAMEDSFHLEHIKEELYKTQGQNVIKEKKEKTDIERTEQILDVRSEEFEQKDELRAEFIREGKTSSKETGWLKKACIIAVAAIFICGLAVLILMGYLPYLEIGTILGAAIILAACIVLTVRIVQAKKKPGLTRREREEKNNATGQRTEWKKTEQNVSEQKVSEQKISEQYLYISQNMPEQKWENRLYETLKKEPSDQNKNVGQKQQSDYSLEESEPIQLHADYGETVVLSAGVVSGPASLVSKEPGELATIYLNEDLTVIGKLETACDAVISMPTVSRIHAKIRKREEKYYLTDMNSRNGTAVNGRMLLPDEEYQLEPEDEIDFAQARYVFLL